MGCENKGGILNSESRSNYLSHNFGFDRHLGMQLACLPTASSQPRGSYDRNSGRFVPPCEFPAMNRRSLMKLVSRVIGWTCALVVAVPGISFITAPLRRRSSSGGIKQRVVKLDNLRVGEPTQVAITGSRSAGECLPGTAACSAACLTAGFSGASGHLWCIRRRENDMLCYPVFAPLS